MIKQFLLATTLTLSAAAGFAGGYADQVAKTVVLNDGSTLYVFKDGKMGMEGKYGQPTYMAAGQVMEAAAGQKITMNGNEVARVYSVLIETRGIPLN